MTSAQDNRYRSIQVGFVLVCLTLMTYTAIYIWASDTIVVSAIPARVKNSVIVPMIQRLSGKFSLLMINPFPNKSWFEITCLQYTSFENTVVNGEIVHNFYPFRKLSAIFINFEIVVCKLFQFGCV